MLLFGSYSEPDIFTLKNKKQKTFFPRLPSSSSNFFSALGSKVAPQQTQPLPALRFSRPAPDSSLRPPLRGEPAGLHTEVYPAAAAAAAAATNAPCFSKNQGCFLTDGDHERCTLQ